MTIPLATIDQGLGTAYERVAIYDLFDRWSSGLRIERACEGPIDGMAGIPGLHLLSLARRGAHATVCAETDEALERVRSIYRNAGAEGQLETRRVREGETPPGRYDAVVCYNALPIVADWREYLRAIFEVDARWFFIVVSNPVSYGTYLRRAQRTVRGEDVQELFDHEATHREVLEPVLTAHGRIVAHDYLDCPWWPDFLLPAHGNVAGKAMGKVRELLGRGKDTGDAKPRFVFGENEYPFFEDQRGYKDTMRQIRVHPVFDHAPEPVARFFGHLHGYLIEKH